MESTDSTESVVSINPFDSIVAIDCIESTDSIESIYKFLILLNQSLKFAIDQNLSWGGAPYAII